jgi:5-methylcytosine-specific restriction enzyme A
MTNYWIIGTGRRGDRDVLWQDFREENRVRINFSIKEDLGPYVERGYETLTKFINIERPDNSGSANQCWNFAAKITEGDIVIARQGIERIVGLGRITSGYRFDPDLGWYMHICDVEWGWIGDEPWTGQRFHADTVVELTEDNGRFHGLIEFMDARLSEGFNSDYPISSYSWTVYSPRVAVKKMDKSAFLHHGTGVPRDIAFFFNFTSSDDVKSVSLVHSGKGYEGHLSPDIVNERVRLFWQGALSNLIESLMPERHRRLLNDEGEQGPPAEMRFLRQAEDIYVLDFLEPGIIATDAVRFDERLPEGQPRTEGASKTVTSTVYERDPKNRVEAIRIHGHRCVICEFDFGRFYGEWGDGYIEVHHLTPLSQVNDNHVVNPETDLVPVCSNCHRMIHRRKARTLNVNELKEMMGRAAE